MLVLICSTVWSGRDVPSSAQLCCQRATTGSIWGDSSGSMMTGIKNLLNFLPSLRRRNRWKYGQYDTLRRRTRSLGGNPPNEDNTGCRVYEPCPRCAGRRRWVVVAYGSVAGRHARHDTTLRAAPAHQGAHI